MKCIIWIGFIFLNVWFIEILVEWGVVFMKPGTLSIPSFVRLVETHQ